ncbi:DUF4390 domain-containing protein [Thermosulfurimonas marina]|uniref:DUF4390 domain-containing protein n=1 Tax=Thermosulfurimonas marina TaxID=2047767 RepID=A0A6H1WTU1_9BACT|nr:DUF4390 domain-containing protein [Thermosulfurimonas marina]QJA06612.1 DUF4390 domain-containing protein [Thermosulfurimonas marina]
MRPLALFLLLVLMASPAEALRLRDFSVAPYQDYLLLYAYVEDLPEADLKEAMRHGLGLSFTYEVEIKRLRRFLRDETLLAQEIVRTVYYDPVKNLYFVHTVGASAAPYRAPSFRQALALASSLEGVPLLPLNRFEAGRRYRVSLRVRIRKFTRVSFPQRLLRVLLFRGETLESPWQSLVFTP